MQALFRYLLWILIAVLPLHAGVAAAQSCAAVSMHGAAASDRQHCADAPADKSIQGKCKSGASCCLGAIAPPRALASHASVRLPTFAHLASEPAMTAFTPPTPERPPRFPA